MDKEFLIVGHGLAGCVLGLTFHRKNIPFRIIGSPRPEEASMASSGLITPVTGRKYVKSWMIDELISAALDFYPWTEKLFDRQYFYPVDIVRFLSHPEALAAWQMRSEDDSYKKYISAKRFEELDRMNKPYGILTGGFRLDAVEWLKAARTFLTVKGLLEEREHFVKHEEDGLLNIIFATGAIGEIVSKGIIPNKGEALIVKMPGWKYPAIIKEEVFFVPLEEDDVFWVGSYYEPWPEHGNPSVSGKQKLIKAIEEVYQDSFIILEHWAGVRATVEDRRPVIGPYPGKENCYLFNGMGTKGTSLAPYWANQFIAYLTEGCALPKIVSPNRYL